MDIIEIKDDGLLKHLFVIENNRIIEYQKHDTYIMNPTKEKFTILNERLIFNYKKDSPIPYSMFIINEDGTYKNYFTKIVEASPMNWEFQYREIWRYDNSELTPKIYTRELIKNYRDFKTRKDYIRTDTYYQYHHHIDEIYVTEFIYDKDGCKLIEEKEFFVENRRLILNYIIKFLINVTQTIRFHKLTLKLRECKAQRMYAKDELFKHNLNERGVIYIHHSYFNVNIINEKINEVKSILKENGYNNINFDYKFNYHV